MRNQLQLLCQNRYTVVPVLLQMSIHTLGSIFLYLPWKNQSIQLCQLAECTPSQQPIHPTPPKPRISIATEVDDLLTWAMMDEPSHESEHSPIGKAVTVEAVMSPYYKLDSPPLPVNTSSQASMEEAEASLEGIPANVSPVATTYSSSSASPLTLPISYLNKFK